MTSLGPGYSSKEERRKVTGVVEAPCPSPGTRADLPGPTLHTLGLCRPWGAWSGSSHLMRALEMKAH